MTWRWPVEVVYMSSMRPPSVSKGASSRSVYCPNVGLAVFARRCVTPGRQSPSYAKRCELGMSWIRVPFASNVRSPNRESVSCPAPLEVYSMNWFLRACVAS